MSKAAIKRALFLGLSFSVVLLAMAKAAQHPEIEAGTEGGGDDSTAEPAPLPDSIGGKTLPFRPLAGITVTFSGRVVRNGSRFALKETAGVLYTLDSAGRAWPFEGEDVRVTGQLDTTTRMLHVDDIRSMIA